MARVNTSFFTGIRLIFTIFVFLSSISLAAQETFCNDGIDNDGDGFIDCADPDCDRLANCPVPAECSGLEGDLHFSHPGKNEDTSYTTQYLLTNYSNIIQQVSEDTIFTGLSAGNYIIYALNYKSASGINGNAVNDTLNNISGACFVVGPGTPIRICARPLAVNDSIFTNEDVPVTVNVLLNDSDQDSPLFGDSVRLLTTPAHGAITNTAPGDSSITFIPSPEFFGLDSVQYEICDTSPVQKLCDTAWVYFVVYPVNDPPTQGNEMVATFQDTVIYNISILANNSDPDGDLLSATLPTTSFKGGMVESNSDPFSGNVPGRNRFYAVSRNNNATVNYVPPIGYLGADTVTYTVCDPGLLCVEDTLFITVSAVIIAIDPGQITGDQTNCGSFNPGLISSVLPATGGTINYQWQQSTDDGNNWAIIPSSDLLEYDPPYITQTTWYRRGAQNSTNPGVFVYSDTVRKTIELHVTDGGQISGDETETASFDPMIISSISPASGQGTIEYQWWNRTESGSWTEIVGATGLSYDPPTISETTYYRRDAKTESCEFTQCCVGPWRSSNTIIKEITTPFKDGGGIAVNARLSKVIQGYVIEAAQTPNELKNAYILEYQWEISAEGKSWKELADSRKNYLYVPEVKTISYYRRKLRLPNASQWYYSNELKLGETKEGKKE